MPMKYCTRDMVHFLRAAVADVFTQTNEKTIVPVMKCGYRGVHEEAGSPT